MTDSRRVLGPPDADFRPCHGLWASPAVLKVLVAVVRRVSLAIGVPPQGR
ncbi:hypothetical protein Ga0074812_106366 [Parafrankia irregularis]|uniref:Uncharacterized protein n=1 Tax=Parafrankia irregularis TaxID=795642 RepID=A0A0S4QM38_9ACTN|nr:hypothetical protein Ga0074812_106366 [Parafrankia irregularis]